MISQLSQPSASISVRDIGSMGAVPKHSAQYKGYWFKGLAWEESSICMVDPGRRAILPDNAINCYAGRLVEVLAEAQRRKERKGRQGKAREGKGRQGKW